MATTSPTTPPRTARASTVSAALKRWATVLVLIVMVIDIIMSVVFYRHPVWMINQVMDARLRVAGFHSEYVRVGSYRVHYFVGGDGTPLLLIHGMGARSEDWTPEMPDYAKNGFRVYAVDLLGCGRTDRPDIAYTIGQQVDLIQGFLTAVHVEKADVIGWSMGGWVALEFGLHHPQRVNRLVAMDSAGLKFQTNLSPDILEPNSIPQLKRLEAVLMARQYYIPGFIQRDLLRTMEHNRTVVHRTLESLLVEEGDFGGRLGQLKMPLLLIWGQHDELLPPSVGKQMHSAIPQSVLESYAGCGHMGPATCSDRMVPKVIDFLRSQPPMQDGEFHY
ncbi:MAG TPA: alpha/beta hydrolase [Acidobacteriaceae bacterium]|nr:alpha/beta hydrolase [Acidobacteriaceae bacterium]